MSLLWRLDCNGVKKTWHDWGIADGVIELMTQGVDSLSFTHKRAKFYDDEAFPNGSTIKLFREEDDGSNSVKWFEGYIDDVPRLGTSNTQNVSYRAVGGWWWFDEIVFEQTYKITNGWIGGDPRNGPNLLDKSNSHVILGLKATGFLTGTFQNTKAQLVEALDWAISRGAPIEYDASTFPDVPFPVDEVRDISVAEVIRKMMRWVPDTICWFDYSVTPIKFYMRRRTELAPVSIRPTYNPATGMGIRVENVSIGAMYKNLRPMVHLKYEQRNTIGDTTWLDVVERFAPNPLPPENQRFKGLVQTIDLQGVKASSAKATIVVEAMDITNLEWWKKKDPSLTDPNIESVEFSQAAQSTPTVDGQVPLTYELKSGQIAPWMTFAGSAVVAQEEVVTCKLKIKHKIGHLKVEKPYSFNVHTTNGTSGQYVNTKLTEIAEPIPEGLENILFAAVGTLQYKGTLELHEKTPTAPAKMGNSINLSGSRSEWATMNAPLTVARFDLEKGITGYTFGTAPHVSLDDLVTLLRTARERRRIMSLLMMMGSSISDTQDVQLGQHTTRANTTSGQGRNEVHVTSASSDPGETDPTKQGIMIINSVEKYYVIKGTPPVQQANGSYTGDGIHTVALTDLKGREGRYRQVQVCVQGNRMYALALITPAEGQPIA